jgi:hypothetical protein
MMGKVVRGSYAVDTLDFVRAEVVADYRPYHVVALHSWIGSDVETRSDAKVIYEGRMQLENYQ